MGDEINKEETQEETQIAEKPLDEMTVKELREIAREIPGVTGFSIMKKEELLSVIMKDRGMEDEIQEEKHALKKPLEKMTAKELKEVAKEIPGVTGVTAMKKEKLLEVIKKAKGIKEEAAVKRRAKKAAADGVGIAELKQKIALLKQEKEETRAARDRKKLDILRRRINRLKKRTRKAAQAA